MSDRLLDKYTAKPERSATLVVDQRGHTASDSVHQPSRTRVDPLVAEEPDEVEDCGCFGYVRGIKERATMLQLHWRDGRVLAVPYGWIERMEYAPDNGIKLRVPGLLVTIQGLRLNHAEARTPRVEPMTTPSLFDTLTRHRVIWIRESPSTLSTSIVQEGVAIVQTILAAE